MTPSTSSGPPSSYPRRSGRSPVSEGRRATRGPDGAMPDAGRGLEQIAGHPLPQRLAEAEEPAVVVWRDEVLPGLVEGLLSEWSLAAQAPFTPGGSTAWVAPVTGAGGTELVLKVAWAHDESRDEAAGMAVWQGWRSEERRVGTEWRAGGGEGRG